MINPMDLTGKHILITGGSSGIGRQCAIQASLLGARVTIIARREAQLKETVQMMDRSNEHAYYLFDLAETADIEKLVKQIVSERGRVDGFVHAAGILGSRFIKQTNPRFVEKMFRVHTFALFELVRCLSLGTNLNDKASLVTVSSVAARCGNISQSAYGAAKASTEGFLNPIALELGSRGIRFNAVEYGIVDTPLAEDHLENGSTTVSKAQYLGVIDKESAANLVAFLLSDACPYITATAISCGGGYGSNVMEVDVCPKQPPVVLR